MIGGDGWESCDWLDFPWSERMVDVAGERLKVKHRLGKRGNAPA